MAFLPIGLCEPHGQIAALGLDTIKADYYCDEAARRFGGIVAPTQGYHIHECGFHAPWLEEVVGEENPLLGGMPPHVICYHFLYQLRAYANAGFRAVIVVSGHSGGSQIDLRRVADKFAAVCEIEVCVKTDPEWVEDLYQGDHAGKYEISQLMAIAPGLVDMTLLDEGRRPGSGGRLALGGDASEASQEHGKRINEAIVGAIGERVTEVRSRLGGKPLADPRISYEKTESIWREILDQSPGWFSNQPTPDQPEVRADSRWKAYEHPHPPLGSSPSSRST